MAFVLGCEKVSLEYPTTRVFEELSLGVEEGDRIGIVGRNGHGKSTLLKVMAGLVEPDAGRVLRNGVVSVGVLGQADALDDAGTVQRAVVGDAPEYEWASDARVRDVIDGLLGTSPGTRWWARFQAASAAGSTWRGCWWANGTCSCWTSPPTTWTCAPSPG